MRTIRKQRLTIFAVLALLVVAIYAATYSRLFGVADGDDKTVTVVLKSLNVRSDYWQTAASGAQTAAKELGVELDLQGPLQETDTDAQIRALEEAIERRPDAIAVAPIADARMPEVLENIRKAGIALVVMDTPIALGSTPVVVSSNHSQAGRLAGDTAASLTKDEPVVAIFRDAPDSPVSLARYEGIVDSLNAFEGSLYGSYFVGDSEQQAYETADSLLKQNPKFNAFVALNEAATLGIAKALKEQNKTEAYKLIGFDSSIYEIQLLEEGTVNALVVQKPFNLGYLGVKTAIKLANGDRTEKATLIDSTVVTRENMGLPENQKLLFPFTVIQ